MKRLEVRLRREPGATDLSEEAVLSVVRYLSSVAHRQEIFFLWRPGLPDPKDDMEKVSINSSARRWRRRCPP
jgi:hypothetical protein